MNDIYAENHQNDIGLTPIERVRLELHLSNEYLRAPELEAEDVEELLKAYDALLGAQGWRDISTAPKDGKPILAWCDHEADPYCEDEKTGRLTLYGAHAEGMSYAPTGQHIVVWGGGFDDRSYFDPNGAHLPDWWFVAGSEFEQAANPTHWQPLQTAPARMIADQHGGEK